MKTKGYVMPSGYMGYLPSPGKYLLFATETEYMEYIGVYEGEQEDEED